MNEGLSALPRVGIGYDIHRVDAERPLVLGGVSFPGVPGLAGHSDADVLLHAVMDAVLGAAGLPDIGHHFPNTHERWRGASSVALLGQVMALVRDEGYRVGNIDCVVVAEQPPILPRVAEIKRCLGAALELDETRISIKATTSEGTGPEGRGEAISAQAIVLIHQIPQ